MQCARPLRRAASALFESGPMLIRHYCDPVVLSQQYVGSPNFFSLSHNFLPTFGEDKQRSAAMRNGKLGEQGGMRP